MYRLGPLPWRQSDRRQDSWSAETPFGTYYVEFWPGHANGPSWRWSWSEEREPLDHPCDSLAHGKQLAEQHLRERVLPMLEPVEATDPEHLLMVARDLLEEAGDERAAAITAVLNGYGHPSPTVRLLREMAAANALEADDALDYFRRSLD